ncbi:MAG: sulfotransferase [Pseudomonadota bacterium]
MAATTEQAPLETLKQAGMLARSGRLAEAALLLEQAAASSVRPAPLLLEAGRLYLQARDRSGARRCWTAAVDADPALVPARTNLGLLLGELGEAAAGKAQLEAALALKPGDPDILANLGAVTTNLSPPEAIGHLRAALARAPDHRLALANLAAVAGKSGLADEALRCLERLAALDPGNPKWRLQMAFLLSKEDRLDEARASYSAVLATEPGNRIALSGLGRLARIRSDRPEEVACLKRLLALDPNHVGALARLAEIEPPPAELRLRMERSAEDPARPPVERFPLHFALYRLGKAEQAEPGPTFRHLAEANRLKAADQASTGHIHYDSAAESLKVERTIAFFDSAWFRDHAGEGDPTTRLVFIVGMPRSGSTLCEQILASHSQAAGVGERVDMARIAEELAAELGGVWPDALARLDAPRLRAKAADYMAMIERQAGKAAIAVDKTLTNILYLGLIAALFPRARIVHARRHPMDVGFSCFEQDFSQPLPWTLDLELIAHYYGLHRRLMAHWRRVLPLPILDWRYEAVVADIEGATRRLLGFCGLDFEPACLAFHETPRVVHTASTEQVRQPLYASSVGKWRRYEKELAPLAEALRAQGVEIEEA